MASHCSAHAGLGHPGFAARPPRRRGRGPRGGPTGAFSWHRDSGAQPATARAHRPAGRRLTAEGLEDPFGDLVVVLQDAAGAPQPVDPEDDPVAGPAALDRYVNSDHDGPLGQLTRWGYRAQNSAPAAAVRPSLRHRSRSTSDQGRLMCAPFQRAYQWGWFGVTGRRAQAHASSKGTRRRSRYCNTSAGHSQWSSMPESTASTRFGVTVVARRLHPGAGAAVGDVEAVDDATDLNFGRPHAASLDDDRPGPVRHGVAHVVRVRPDQADDHGDSPGRRVGPRGVTVGEHHDDLGSGSQPGRGRDAGAHVGAATARRARRPTPGPPW